MCPRHQERIGMVVSSIFAGGLGGKRNFGMKKCEAFGHANNEEISSTNLGSEIFTTL